MALPRRKPNRLPNYDYSQAGYYFITLCTKDKQPLSSIGRVVDEAIRAIPAHYPNVALDKFVVMPNHIHLILALAEPDGRIISAPTKPLSTVIGSMKRAAAKRAGIPLWQKSFHDHVIRGEADYRRIWSYIDANPRKWREDCYYV